MVNGTLRSPILFIITLQGRHSFRKEKTALLLEAKLAADENNLRSKNDIAFVLCPVHHVDLVSQGVAAIIEWPAIDIERVNGHPHGARDGLIAIAQHRHLIRIFKSRSIVDQEDIEKRIVLLIPQVTIAIPEFE